MNKSIRLLDSLYSHSSIVFSQLLHLEGVDGIRLKNTSAQWDSEAAFTAAMLMYYLTIARTKNIRRNPLVKFNHETSWVMVGLWL